jgi:hypothetical protein
MFGAGVTKPSPKHPGRLMQLAGVLFWLATWAEISEGRYSCSPLFLSCGPIPRAEPIDVIG